MHGELKVVKVDFSLEIKRSGSTSVSESEASSIRVFHSYALL